jgi:hypothetical protein
MRASFGRMQPIETRVPAQSMRRDVVAEMQNRISIILFPHRSLFLNTPQGNDIHNSLAYGTLIFNVSVSLAELF